MLVGSHSDSQSTGILQVTSTSNDEAIPVRAIEQSVPIQRTNVVPMLAGDTMVADTAPVGSQVKEHGAQLTEESCSQSIHGE